MIPMRGDTNLGEEWDDVFDRMDLAETSEERKAIFNEWIAERTRRVHDVLDGILTSDEIH